MSGGIDTLLITLTRSPLLDECNRVGSDKNTPKQQETKENLMVFSSHCCPQHSEHQQQKLTIINFA